MEQTNKPWSINIAVFWHNLVYKGFFVVYVAEGY